MRRKKGRDSEKKGGDNRKKSDGGRVLRDRY